MYSTKYIYPITKEYIYSKISRYDLFKRYVSNFKQVNRLFCSELRELKKGTPSCSITNKYGDLLYYDFATQDCFDPIAYVSIKYNIPFKEALELIAADFNLKPGNYIQPSKPVIELHREKTTIRIKRIEYTAEGLNYWLNESDGLITKEVLEQEDVVQLSHMWINDNLIYLKNSLYPKDVAFSFEEFKNGYRKILRPNYKQELKWRSNLTNSHFFGIDKLKFNNDLLIITKSKKDQIIWSLIGFDCIGTQSEGVSILTQKTKEILTKYNNIIINYDPDTAGVNAFNKTLNELNSLNCFKSIKPLYFNKIDKDISGYVKHNKRSKLAEIRQRICEQ